jgi:hypothetical protein
VPAVAIRVRFIYIDDVMRVISGYYIVLCSVANFFLRRKRRDGELFSTTCVSKKQLIRGSWISFYGVQNDENTGAGTNYLVYKLFIVKVLV